MATSLKTKLKLIKMVKEKTGVKFRYYFRDMRCSAEVDPRTARIGFAKEKREEWQTDSMEEFIGDILHELVHIWCYRNRKFMAYHRDPRTRAQKIAHIATAYRAECWVDQKAKEWAKNLFGIKYKLVYTKKKSDKKWFDDNYLDYYRKLWNIGKVKSGRKSKRSAR